MLIEKCQNCCRVLELFRHDNIFAKSRTKMTTVSRFSRQNDAGLRALNVVLYKQEPSFGAKICSDICPRTLSVPRSSRKTVSFEEQIMSKDKYPSIFSQPN